MLADVPPGMYQLTVTQEGFASTLIEAVVLNVAERAHMDVQLNAGAVAEQITVDAVPSGRDDRRRGGRPGHRRAGAGAAAQRPQLHPAHPAHARRQRAGQLRHQEQGADDRLRPLGQRRRRSPRTCGRSTAPTTTTSDRTARSSSTPRWTRSRSSRSTATATAPSSAAPAAPRSTSSPAAATNQFQGSVFYFRRDDAWNEKNYFLEKAGQDKEKLSARRLRLHVRRADPPRQAPLLRLRRSGTTSSAASCDRVRADRRPSATATSAVRARRLRAAVPTDPLTGLPFPGNRIPADRLSPAGCSTCSSTRSQHDAAGRPCINWVESVDTPDRLAAGERPLRLARHRHDAGDAALHRGRWLNGAPNATSRTALGRRHVPGRRLHLGPAGLLDRGPAQPDHRRARGQHPPASPSRATRSSSTRGGNEAGAQRPAPRGRAVRSSRTAGAQRRRISARIRSSGAAGVRRALEHRALGEPAGPDGLQGRLPGDLRQALAQGGVLYSDNTKDECGAVGAEPAAVLGRRAGVNGWGATTGNVLADFLLRDMTGASPRTRRTRRPTSEWKDSEAYIADSWQALPHHPRLRLAVFVLREPRQAQNEYASFNPDRYNPAFGASRATACCYPPGQQLRRAGFAGGTRAQPFARRGGQGQHRAAVRLRLGRLRQRQLGAAPRLRPVLPA